MPNSSVCKSCGASIIRMPIGGDNPTSVPVNAYTVRDGDETYDGEQHELHRDTCPHTSTHRTNQSRLGGRGSYGSSA
jgi:hypothetical protein